MARQQGILKFKGNIGSFSMYKTQDGFQGREKSGIEPGRVLNDPAFQRTRENLAEFAQVAQSAKLLRVALRSALINIADNKVHQRLVSEMFNVLRTDSVHRRGERLVAAGNLELLKNFEFNSNSKLMTTYQGPFRTSIDRVTGKMTVALNSFSPQTFIAQLPGATHCTLIAAGAELDFASGEYAFDEATAEIALGPQTEPARTLTVDLTPGSTKSLFLTFGITFTQVVNGESYALKNGFYNGIAIVAVDNTI
jgi:hypothetical protein